MVPTRLLPQRVTIRAYQGIDAYGSGSYAAPVVVRARVQSTRRVVVANGDADDIAETTVILPGGVECPPRSMVRIPGDDFERAVLTRSEVYAAHGVHHVEITTK